MNSLIAETLSQS